MKQPAPLGSAYQRYKLDCLEETKLQLAIEGTSQQTPLPKVKRLLAAIGEIDLLISKLRNIDEVTL